MSLLMAGCIVASKSRGKYISQMAVDTPTSH